MRNQAISEAVDKVYNIKIECLQAEIQIAISVLMKEGELLGIKMDDDPKLILELLEDYETDPIVGKHIQRGLKNLNCSVINCTLHLDEAFYQKSLDTHDKLSTIDPATVLRKTEMTDFSELICHV